MPDNGSATHCALLALPLEIRLQIWSILLHPPGPLVMRSLFIRHNFRNVFMSQQPKLLNLNVLRLCRKVAAEAIPILYAQATWMAACRLESLASQIGITNFAFIKRLFVDADDLTSIVGSLILDLQEQDPTSRSLVGSPSIELRSELESRALMENIMLTCSDQVFMPTAIISQRRLRFSNLDVLEVDGYQAMALTSRGNRKCRREGLRLCSFAKQILKYHPSLDVVVQQAPTGSGGSDALDYTMARVHWRFLRVGGTNAPQKNELEHFLDIAALEDMLQRLIELDEEDNTVRRSERRRLAGWLEDGRFMQYPYLSTTPMMS